MVVHSQSNRTIAFFALLVATVATISGQAAAQFKVTDLVSNQAGKASHQDTQLVNAWGMAYSPTGPFWVSDNGTGVSTLYTAAGLKQTLVVTIPPASGTGLGSPTGQVYNGTLSFVVTQGTKSGVAQFIFATSDGTISGWSPTVNSNTAVIAVNNPGASYTGLAIGVNGGANFLFAADNKNNKVDIYDGTFALTGSFTDNSLPPGSAPYGIQNIGGQLYVTFTNSTGGGVVDIFDTGGNLVKNFATGGTLKTPWGVALAPSNFKTASNAILVGNLGDGRINIFSASTGKFLGQMKNSTKTAVISVPFLWGLTFGGGSPSNGNKNQLFFTAGPNGYKNGLFGVIQ